MTPAHPVIALQGVTKRYRGRTILDEATLVLRSGQVAGLVGPNGSGKTTVLRLLAGLVQPDHGRVADRHPDGATPTVGVLFDPPGLLPRLSGRANLRLLASLRGVIGDADVARWLVKVGLDPADRTPVGLYSQGMVQRLGIAQALMESPTLVLLDEPTNALDATGVALLVSLLREQRDQGTAVVVATHHIEEVVEVCDAVWEISDGHLRPAADGMRRPGPPAGDS